MLHNIKKYNLVVCGGTFDLLHKGHKKFLQDILDISLEVLLGITSDSYVTELKNKQIESFEIRKKVVEDFLESIEARERVKIVSINQTQGPLLTNAFNPRAIVVTPKTQSVAIEINIKRKYLGLPNLEIIVIEMKPAEDGDLISSTRIRNGEINRDGRLYLQKSWLENKLCLPNSLRPLLQKPFGKILNSVPSGLTAQKIIVVGDISTQKFNKKGIGQFLSIVDFIVRREKKFNKLSELGFTDDIPTIMVENEPGTITPELFGAIKSAFATKRRQVILVKGEEDLSFLPIMLLAPLGFSVYYGQPNQGLVEVAITEENKEKVYDLISKFTY